MIQFYRALLKNQGIKCWNGRWTSALSGSISSGIAGTTLTTTAAAATTTTIIITTTAAAATTTTTTTTTT